MSIILGAVTHGQAVALALFGVLLALIIVDVSLVLFLRSKNRKLAKKQDEEAESADGTSTQTDESTTEKL